MEKWFLKSKTVWGGIIAALPAFASVFGLPISVGEIAGLDHAVGQGLDAVQSLIGLGLLVYGRHVSGGETLSVLPK